MDSKKISNWLRQTRYRARKNNIHSEVEIDDIQQIISGLNGTCAYCDNTAESLDCVFQLAEDAPHVPANILPVCSDCKDYKKNNNIIWMFSSGRITEEQYIEILSQMFERTGGDEIKDLTRRLSGLTDE